MSGHNAGKKLKRKRGLNSSYSLRTRKSNNNIKNFTYTHTYLTHFKFISEAYVLFFLVEPVTESSSESFQRSTNSEGDVPEGISVAKGDISMSAIMAKLKTNTSQEDASFDLVNNTSAPVSRDDKTSTTVEGNHFLHFTAQYILYSY